MSHQDLSPYLSLPGQPFNCTELQQQFFGMSARDVYTLLCKRSGCEPVSAVTSLLPEKSGVWDTVELDLSKSYVGHRGVVPLMELCKLLHKLKTLNLRNNFLTNKSIWHVTKMAMFHPALQTIDISRNDISWTAGMCVLELVSRNPQISLVNVTETLIKPSVAESIETQIRRNSNSGNRRNRKGANPTNHPITIRQRALKRFFRDVVNREQAAESKIGKAFVADGYKEMLRLCGREKELQQRSPAFFAALVKRSPAELIDWETFMLLIMVEESDYDQTLVDSLRAIFVKYDVDASGYVELAEMTGMLQTATGAVPTEREVAAKLLFYGADSSMTVTWDEFLLLMYDHGPTVGEFVSLTTQTPLRRAKAQHH